MSDNLQGFPFGTAAAFQSGDPFLGGQIVILPVGAASTNVVIAHSLRRVPRAFLVLDVGAQTFGSSGGTVPVYYGGSTTSAGVSIPFARGTTAWNQATFSLALPALTAPVTGVLL